MNVWRQDFVVSYPSFVKLLTSRLPGTSGGIWSALELDPGRKSTRYSLIINVGVGFGYYLLRLECGRYVGIPH